MSAKKKVGTKDNTVKDISNQIIKMHRGLSDDSHPRLTTHTH